MFKPTVAQTHGAFIVERFDGLSNLTGSAQSDMVRLFEDIWRQLYTGQPEHSFEEIASSFFHPEQAIFLVKTNNEYVGFSIRRHCEVGQYRVINARVTGVVPQFQKYNLYSLIRRLDYEFEWETEPERPRLLYYRTRNPILWFEVAKRCSRIALDLSTGQRDQHLVEMGVVLAREFYPEYSYDPETMTCHNVYLSHGKQVYYKTLPHHKDPKLDSLFYAHPAMANTRDSPCFVGILTPPASVGEAHQAPTSSSLSMRG